MKEGANYPLVARKDFLKTKLGDKLFNVPNEAGANLQPLPKFDVVVGNPPYVEQKKINEYYGKSYKDSLQQSVRKDAPDTEISAKSDIYCYFFTHSFPLLEDDSYVGFLTSSNWLDTLYGFDLQKFLLENFEIVAVLESNCEGWFEGARVGTAATILRKQPDTKKRNANNVKFVWLKKPIADFVAYSKGDEEQRRATFEQIREHIENLTEEEENETWRVRVVNQAELFQAGCLIFDVQAEDEDDDEDDEENEETPKNAIKATQTNFLGVPEQPSLQIVSENPKTKSRDFHSEYKGYKWGIFLRAPEILSKLLKRGENRFMPLGQLTDVSRGITTGCNPFFYLKDVTAEKLAENLTDKEFKDRYGISKKETEKIRIVHAGDKSQHLIETEFLEPEIHTVLGLNSVEIVPSELKQKVLLVNKNKNELKNRRVLKYLEYGEREKFTERPTIAGRAKTGRNWYDITQDKRGDIVWAKAHQYRHLVWLNPDKLIVNNRMYNVFVPHNTNAKVLCAASS